MGILRQLAAEYKTLSIVGMAKNAGKTTTLNYLIEEAMDEGLALGVTSTGRDGETTDLVTGTDKPKVFLEAGTLVSVPSRLYELAEAGLEILKMTGYSTSIGQLMLCRVAESGYVQIAGPVITSEHRRLCQEMLDLGADMVLIDGAVDRRSIADPKASDAVILATGAVLSRNLKTVVAETARLIETYRLPRLEEGKLRRQLQQESGEEAVLLYEMGRLRRLDLKTGLGAGTRLDKEIREDTELIYIPGAFTKSSIEGIRPAKLRQVTFLLKDPTRIFFDGASWQQMKKRGLTVKVMNNIRVAAVTVNPYAPAGYRFDHKELLDAMRQALPDIPVMDVML